MAGAGRRARCVGAHLVDRLLTLVVASTHAGTALAADGINLVDEDDAGRLGLGLLEQVPDAGRADTDKELDELRRGAREEGRASLASDSLRWR